MRRPTESRRLFARCWLFAGGPLGEVTMTLAPELSRGQPIALNRTQGDTLEFPAENGF